MKKLSLIIIALIAFVQGAWAQTTNVGTAEELRNAIVNGANITLTQDITISSAITVGNGQTVTINLGGFTLNRGCTSRGSQTIGVFSGGTLYLSNGTVTGGWGGGGGGMFNEGTMHLINVTITGNTADDRAGGISNNGTLTMTGCTVSNNTSRDAVDPAGGGGIFNYSGKTATLTNCTITGNTANTYGGGGICNYGTMTLDNCSVKNNNANTTGGGIFCSTTSTLSINGCDITGNSAVSYGDGIYIDNSTINMQGLCKVTGNTDSNIYLYGSGTVITVSGAFTSGSSIGLGVTDYGRKLTSGYSTYNSGTDPSEFFSMDNYMYGIGEKDGEAFPDITYWDHSWEGGDTDGHVVNTRKVCTDYSNYSDTEDLNTGWYVLSGSHTYEKRPRCHGDVKFILVDGSDTEFKKGIHIDNPQHLTIYGQDNGTGKLRCTGDGGSASNGDAAIGGNNEVVGGHLIIHGGTIEAEPNHNNAAGIGGGDGASGMQSVTIWDGKIEAKGHSSGAGIGAGKDNSVIPTVTIYGGNINTESASKGAGIGGGEGSSNNTIIIFGGNITAKGGSKGSGIGSGYKGDVDNPITIYGGTITATGGSEAAGIGAGSGANISGGTNYGHQNEKITIYGATVTAKGGKEAAGIGAGKIGKGGTIDITNSTVYATGGESGSGIGGGIHTTSASGSGNAGTVTIKNSYVEAIGVSAIGGGRGGNGGSVNIDNSSTVKVQCTDANGDGGSYEDNAFIGSGGSVSSEEGLDGNLSLGTNLKVSLDGSTKSSGQRRSTCQSHPDDYDMVVTIEPCDHSGANYTIKNESKHKINCSYCEGVEENHDTDGESGSCSKCGYGGTGYTITFYEANEDGTGYSTTPITYTTGYQVSFTLPECTSVPNDKWAFVGWKALTGDAPTSLLADDSELSSLESAGKSFKVSENVTYYARYQVCWTGAGSGTSSDPYQIKTADDWNYIATKVSGGKINYSGKCFKMTDNISVTTQIGTYNDDSKYFGGNFNGDGHTLTFNISGSSQGMAPFGNVRSATIRNLVICGSIENSAKFASGLIGSMKSGTTTISNCRVNAIVSNTISGDGTSGGFVANIQGGTVNFTRCIFDGTLSGSSTTGWGGYVGWNAGGANVNFTNCLFKPDANSNVTDGCTFARYRTESDMTITNSYYTQVLGSAQGTQAYTIESGTDDLWLYYGDLNYGDEDEAIAELQYFENKIFPFDNGLLYQKKFYTIGTANVTFTPVIPGYIATGLSASAGSLTDNLDYTFTLAMNSANSTINATGRTAAVIRVVDEAPYWDSISTGWVFISSPLTDATMPTTVYGLVPEIESHYDLYQLNPSTTKWENWKVGDNTNVNPGFDLVNGKGYLYATKDGTTLVFTGTINNESTKTIENLPVGFNLVGNPFTDSATINKSYYTLNETGSYIVATEVSGTTPIAPCTGVIVEVTNTTENITFTKVTQQTNAIPNNGSLRITLSQVVEPVEGPARNGNVSSGVGVSTGSTTLALDNAIITFNEDSQLGKFYFGKQNARIYIPQNGTDYAIAFSEGQGEIPLNFKAKENGTYKISVNPEGVEMGYLHLIDNMTGADVDLLPPLRGGQGESKQASYTFQAKTTDYASRFRLVFATQTDADSDADAPFAFISNGNIIITGEGTLQMMDMTGHVIVSREGDAINRVSTSGMAPGVYVLRLIDGDSVRTQKIVVR